MGRSAGQTLIELLVVVGIVGILVTMAVPVYFRMVAHAKRGEASTELANLAHLENGFFGEYGTYGDNLGAMGYGQLSSAVSSVYAVGFPANTGCSDLTPANFKPQPNYPVVPADNYPAAQILRGNCAYYPGQCSSTVPINPLSGKQNYTVFGKVTSSILTPNTSTATSVSGFAACRTSSPGGQAYDVSSSTGAPTADDGYLAGAFGCIKRGEDAVTCCDSSGATGCVGNTDVWQIDQTNQLRNVQDGE